MSGARSTLARCAWAVRFTGRVSVRLVLIPLIATTLLSAALVSAALAADADLIASNRPAGQDRELVGYLPQVNETERMLVESDQLVYDYDQGTVSAVGNVVIYYGGYTLEADRVIYDQADGRLIAIGAVKLTEPSGATFRSDHFDITDDFAEGFIRSLSVETTERTYIQAESAVRSPEQTVFTNGAYSACPSCMQNPDKPPFWKIKAKKIIVDHETRVIRFSDASFEFFGTPIAWLPRFAIADPSVKRKSGLLAPNIGYSDKLGTSLSVPYYWALAPNYDLTVTATGFKRQGVMGDVTWRHRTQNGQYAINVAGISQNDKSAFHTASAGFRDKRGGVSTTGLYQVGRDWTLGWDGTLTTDRTFTRDYGVLRGDASETTSTIHLTGLRDRNYFEARAYHFKILTDPLPGDPKIPDPTIYDQGRQAVALPIIDHQYFRDDPVLGGQFSLTSNIAGLYREEDDPFTTSSGTFYHGTMGTTIRATKELAWKKRVITGSGLVVEPFAFARADAFQLNPGTSAATGIGMTTDSFAYRAMPAAGVDVKYPILITGRNSTHIIEPRAQLILRPNEMRAGELPNNDAQSLVFDETNLFDYDKFSGYDRNEGGTRLNVGVHYNGTFTNGGGIQGTFGQSYQLAGVNPFAAPDLANVGPGSGLETTVSDFVAGGTVDAGFGPRFHARGRFASSDFSIKRAEFGATTAMGAFTTSSSFVFLSANPNSVVTSPSSVIRTAASVNLMENWRAFGSVTYDVSNAAIASDSFGIAYDDESATVSLTYSETHGSYTDLSASRWINLRVQLRTIGEGGISNNLNKLK